MSTFEKLKEGAVTLEQEQKNSITGGSRFCRNRKLQCQQSSIRRANLGGQSYWTLYKNCMSWYPQC